MVNGAPNTMTTTTSPVDFRVLSRLQPICALPEARLRELAGLCHRENVGRSVDPFRLNGSRKQSVYLLSGELKLSFVDGSSSVMVGGSEAAAWSLTRQPPAVRDARAITDVSLIRIDDDVLDIMMTWDQVAVGAGGSLARDQATEATDWRMMTGAFRLPSLTSGALSRLPVANIEELFRRFERIRTAAGELILSQGEEGDYYYIVESGRCEVTRLVGGVVMALAELKAGDAFGEEALVAESRRNATIRMKTDGALLRLKKQDFVELLREPLLKRLAWREAQKRQAAGALWLDVRYPSEYQFDRLPGAINVPLGEIRNAIGLLDREREYLVYCQSGRRSSAAAFLLSQHGYQACWLDGGLNANEIS